MAQLPLRRIALAACALVLASHAGAQAAVPTAKARTIALAIMKGARYCTLVTNGLDGQPQSRVVDPLIENEGTIWIATNPRSRKVQEIARDGRVTLTFFDTKANDFVTVIGRATVVRDSAQKARHWKADWAPFYKQQTRGADFMLYEVRASRLEIVSPGRGMMNDAQTWRPVIVNLP